MGKLGSMQWDPEGLAKKERSVRMENDALSILPSRDKFTIRAGNFGCCPAQKPDVPRGGTPGEWNPGSSGENNRSRQTGARALRPPD